MRGRLTAGIWLGVALVHLFDKGIYRSYVRSWHARPAATLFVQPLMSVRGRRRGSASYARHRSVARRTAPRELVDLYGMRSRELKQFLKEKGVSVDDCFDPESLMDRAAETQELWAKQTPEATSPQAAKVPAAAPTKAPAPAPASAPARAPPSLAEIEAAWSRISEAWPGKDVSEYGPTTADKSVILLHGFGDTDAQFMSKNFEVLQDVNGMRVLLPQAPQETLQDARMQSWFLPTKGQWILDDAVATPTVAYVHTMIRREIGRGVSPGRIMVAGFGQGGGLAVRAALSFPDAPLGGAVALSSFFGAPTATVAMANKDLKVLVCHGTDDEVVEFSEGERLAKLLPGLQKAGQVTFKSYKMEHGVSRDEFTDVLEFIKDRMEAPEEEEPLEFDPAGMSETPELEPVTMLPVEAKVPEEVPKEVPKGVPTLDPELTLELMNDPDMIEATKDPEIMAVVQDIIMSPDNFDKHIGNPRVAKVLDRIYALTNGEVALKPGTLTPAAEEVVTAPDVFEERMPDGKKKKVRVPIRDS